MPSATAPITNAPPILWAALRALITTIFALFGEPQRIAAQHTHRKSERTLLLKWLRAGEALMRHLLLIEAAHHAKPNTRPLLRANKLLLGKRRRRPMSFEADKPEAWRVSFRVLHLPPRRGGSAERSEAKGDVDGARAPSDAFGVSSPARGGDKRRFYSAWPLAERAEALLRAFNNPEPYAKRLAARLHTTPHRAADITRYPENLPQVIDCFDTLRETVRAARRRIESG